jgi:hypothetical protein
VKFSDFENELLVAIYNESHSRPNETISSGEILDLYPLQWREGWVHQVVNDFGNRGYIYGKGVFGDERSQPLRLKAAGMREAERLEESGVSIFRMEKPEQALTSSAAYPPTEIQEQSAPASDRLVGFDHNLPEYIDIADQLTSVAESIRGANDSDLNELERSRITAGLSAAQQLWSAFQLKAIQIKVGVIMAVEDAAKALGSNAKAIAAALLVDTIKAFVKNHGGIDLDHI